MRALAAAYQIDFSSDGELLRAHVTGGDSAMETLTSYWTAIAEAVAHQQVTSLLVVDETPGDPPQPEQMLLFLREMAQSGLKGVRIAYVDTAVGHDAEVEFAEILAREHGFNVRVTGTEADARIWLRQAAD